MRTNFAGSQVFLCNPVELSTSYGLDSRHRHLIVLRLLRVGDNGYRLGLPLC
jgi:hypothetical protein